MRRNLLRRLRNNQIHTRRTRLHPDPRDPLRVPLLRLQLQLHKLFHQSNEVPLVPLLRLHHLVHESTVLRLRNKNLRHLMLIRDLYVRLFHLHLGTQLQTIRLHRLVQVKNHILVTFLVLLGLVPTLSRYFVITLVFQTL